MPALDCPHCGAYANFQHQWSRDATEPMSYDFPLSGLYTCDHCEYPIAVTYQGLSVNFDQYWPTKTGRKEFPDVPAPIASTASQAHICLAANAPHGAVALARAVVESVAKAKGIIRGNLESKIDKLCDEGHISEAMKEAAHEIRFAGNEVAHGDLVAEPLTKDDAQDIVSLMDTILERVYQEPAQVTRIRQDRMEREARQASATEGASNGSEEVSLDMPKPARPKPGRLIVA